LKQSRVLIALAALVLTGTSLGKNVLQSDEPPKVVRAVAPAYSFLARSAYLEGEVRVEATIDRAGAVVEAKIINPSKHKTLHEAVEKAAARWKFSSVLN
jgi:TonB family protein